MRAYFFPIQYKALRAMLKMVTSECYRLLAATIAVTAGQVFHCPESRSDSRARTELPPPAHSLGAHYLGFASLPSSPKMTPRR